MALDYSIVLHGKYLDFLVEGAVTTVALAAASWMTAVPVALVITGLRASSLSLARAGAIAFVEYHRSIPLLVQLLVWYFAISELLPRSVNQLINSVNSEMIFAIISLSLYSGAYMSEELRSGLRGIPAGQHDAAKALGLNYIRTMRLVIIPQAWRAAVPPLVSQALILFKGTSLASAIGVAELTYQARQIETQTFRPFEAFSAVTLIYMVGTFTLMFFGDALTRRVRIVGLRNA